MEGKVTLAYFFGTVKTQQEVCTPPSGVGADLGTSGFGSSARGSLGAEGSVPIREKGHLLGPDAGGTVGLGWAHTRTRFLQAAVKGCYREVLKSRVTSQVRIQEADLLTRFQC